MKIAIFGGSFNPVHNEHISIVKCAIKSLSLDKVIIIPTYATPAKYGKMSASPQDRLNMCKIAFASVDKAEVGDCEIVGGGISYSYITCQKFKNAYPDAERYFIVGGDALENFPKWKCPQEILKCVSLAVCAREDKIKLDRAYRNFVSLFGERAVIFDYVGAKVSSTRIRALAALGENLNEFVPERIEKYINDNALYLIAEADKVKKSLSQHRWKHTVGVAIASAENCAKFGVDEKKAITAALFHDCAKELPFCSPLIADCHIAKDVPKAVIHQFTGAYLAERIYGVDDSEILNAVKYHCSGKDDMTALERLTYLADMVEEGRTFDGVEQLRELINKDEVGAFKLAIERQMRHLEGSGLPVYQLTQKAYDYYIKENKEYDE